MKIALNSMSGNWMRKLRNAEKLKIATARWLSMPETALPLFTILESNSPILHLAR